ncbi:sulfite exporter TauE/SafE family protein [Cetobacterium sp. SF1]|uniref:sulfite exporter TauE/SafE family protein n=1 Tax=unclassified Cetobacterium TaxID=2630983 RepID=UPI003CF7C231
MIEKDLIILIITGIGIGSSLMGVSTSIIFSPLILTAYGSKYGNGIMLIPYFFADLYVTYKYRNLFDLKSTLKLIPFSLIGMFIATFLVHIISEDLFQKILGALILLTSLLFFIKKYEKYFIKFGWLFGIVGGLSSYMANISGPIFNIYFLSFDQDPKYFIGNRALFFSLLNFFKLFLYIFIYKNINASTLKLSLFVIPFIFVGIFLTNIFMSKISSKHFSQIVIYISILIAIFLIIK